jgi:glycosyltransferase involved in cell wall biosynthesis
VIAGEMERRSTGVGRYLGGLLHGLRQWSHGVEWQLYLQGEPFDHPLWHDPGVHPQFSNYRGHAVVWEQLVLPWQIRGQELDLLFCPAYSVPFGISVPTVVTIHDLSFEMLPEEFGLRERWRRRLLARRASRVARRVLADCQRVGHEIERCYGVSPSRIGVVPLAVEPELLSPRESEDGLLEALGVRRPFLLVAGTILERRMPRLVLEAFAVIARQRPDLELVFAGSNRLRRPQRLGGWIAELSLARRVRPLGWVSDHDLAALYRSAELTYYLSKYEGFGVPPLESMAFGTPAVVSPGLAFDDLWPDYPYRVTSHDRDHVVDVTANILDNPDRTAAVVGEAGKRLAAATWQESSTRLVRELERALEP